MREKCHVKTTSAIFLCCGNCRQESQHQGETFLLYTDLRSRAETLKLHSLFWLLWQINIHKHTYRPIPANTSLTDLLQRHPRCHIFHATDSCLSTAFLPCLYEMVDVPWLQTMWHFWKIVLCALSIDDILPIDIRRLPSFTTRDYRPACISLLSGDPSSLDQCVGGLVVKQLSLLCCLRNRKGNSFHTYNFWPKGTLLVQLWPVDTTRLFPVQLF